MTKFLPALMSLMVDDEVRRLNAKLPLDERESAITIIEHSGEECYYNVMNKGFIIFLIKFIATLRHSFFLRQKPCLFVRFFLLFR